jgi:hypothetical protein
MERFDAGKVGVHLKMLVGLPVESGADFDVFGILAVIGVVALFEEAGVAALNGGDGVYLNFVHHAENFPNLGVECGWGAKEDVAVLSVHDFGKNVLRV